MNTLPVPVRAAHRGDLGSFRMAAQGRLSAVRTLCAALCAAAWAAGASGGVGCNPDCPADLDGNGIVDGSDLGLLLSDWASTASCANFDGSGDGVDGADIGTMLGAWGACAAVPTCPGSGDCCVVHASSGCSDVECCATVCAADPFCCKDLWDQGCVDLAFASCGICDPGGDCPTTGDCCAVHANAGCNDAECCTTVCQGMPECCIDGWDLLCAEEAQATCDVCFTGGACPGVGDCCVAHLQPGCSTAACCESVCFSMLSCCQDSWDLSCVNLAESLCDECSGGGCPVAGDCCTAHATPGCSDLDCCESVCFDDPSCCDVSWDQSCATLANGACDTCSSSTCPGVGDCCAVHASNGCSDASCCESVCFSDLSCCQTGWDQQCVNVAESVCPECG